MIQWLERDQIPLSAGSFECLVAYYDESTESWVKILSDWRPGYNIFTCEEKGRPFITHFAVINDPEVL